MYEIYSTVLDMVGGYLGKKWIKFLQEYFSFKSLGTCCSLPEFVYKF